MCALCRTDPGRDAVVCPGCQVAYHHGCLGELGERCVTIGCADLEAHLERVRARWWRVRALGGLAALALSLLVLPWSSLDVVSGLVLGSVALPVVVVLGCLALYPPTRPAVPPTPPTPPAPRARLAAPTVEAAPQADAREASVGAAVGVALALPAAIFLPIGLWLDRVDDGFAATPLLLGLSLIVTCFVLPVLVGDSRR